MRRKLLLGGGLVAAGLLLAAEPGLAQEFVVEEERFGEGADILQTVVLDNIFIFFCAVLVFFMQVGFALLESGLTRAKNSANIMMKNLMDCSAGVLVFALIGWGIAYPGDFNGWVGFAGFGIEGFGDPLGTADAVEEYPLGVPVDFFFQAAFAATAATIVSGAVAERTKFVGYLLYTVVITGVIYPIVVSWQWGEGWLYEQGLEDFAGSGIVHMVGGFAALMGAMALGPRIGKFGPDGKPRAIPGHSMPLALTGVLILFIGWFGFNPGSQLQADMEVPIIAVITLFAAASGALGAMITSWIVLKKPDVSMSGNGLLAGLVAICSGVGVIGAIGAIVTGFIAGIIVVLSVLGVERLLKVDDPVGAFSVHGVCGFWGLLATGLFATEMGLFAGGGIDQFITQLIAAVAIAVYMIVVAGALFFGLKAAGLLRVSPEDEQVGLDISEHGAPGYGPDILAGGDAMPTPAGSTSASV